jgi:hypothetical protein
MKRTSGTEKDKAMTGRKEERKQCIFQ